MTHYAIWKPKGYCKWKSLYALKKGSMGALNSTLITTFITQYLELNLDNLRLCWHEKTIWLEQQLFHLQRSRLQSTSIRYAICIHYVCKGWSMSWLGTDNFMQMHTAPHGPHVFLSPSPHRMHSPAVCKFLFFYTKLKASGLLGLHITKYINVSWYEKLKYIQYMWIPTQTSTHNQHWCLLFDNL